MGKAKTTEKLAVLDSEKNEVHIYNVAPEADITPDYIEKLGHNTNNCWYIFGEDISIIEHQGILL